MRGKSRLLNLFLDRNEETALRMVASLDSRNLSEEIRELIRAEAARRGIGPIGLLSKVEPTKESE